MYPLKIALSSYAIIGITLMIVGVSVAVYLFRLSSKTRATKALIVFYSFITLSGLATLLTNGLVHYGRLFTPWQDFWIIAGGIALAQFVYSVPDYKQTNELRAITIAMSSLTALALIYCIVFSYNFVINERPDLQVSDYFYLLLPIGILCVVALFIKRSLEVSTHFRSVHLQLDPGSSFENLVHPSGNNAKMLRAFAFGLLLAFLPAFQTFFGFPPPYGFILSNIGSILAIITIALVYLNYAPEIESFLAKIVGVTLATILLIFAVYGSIDVYNETSDYSSDQTELLLTVFNILTKSGDLVASPPNIAYVVSWDTLDPQNPDRYTQIFLSEDENSFNLNKLIEENKGEFLENWAHPSEGGISQLTNVEWRWVRRYWNYPHGSTHEDYRGYIFTNNDLTYEIGFSSAALYGFTNQVVSEWIVLLLISTTFVLIIFPFFYKRTLVKPIINLLKGVAQVDKGELDTIIPVSSNDEIGYLTESFNRMTISLQGLTFKLREKASELEEQVVQRTMELTKTNEQLVEENKERTKAEIRLKKSLTYQQALANCSRSLLINPGNGKSKREILDRALEYLRSGVKASRTYIYRNIKDAKQGLFVGMIAEVCAPNVSPQINNPANQKFPVSELPTEFVNNLSAGDQFGGPTEELFQSTPDLLDAFLNQPEPLLSVQFFPIFIDDRWWGFIGFDECFTRRKWDSWEITLLQTASEMIGNTLKRWEIEEQLKQTLDDLENRVKDRTQELTQSNIVLYKEIQQRQQAQLDLESRLIVEEQLALISSRLLQPINIRKNIEESLENLAHIMNAGRIFMIEFEPKLSNQLRDFFEWHSSDNQPLNEEILQKLIVSLSGLEKSLVRGETIFIKDTAQYEMGEDVNLDILRARDVKSLVLSPLIIDQDLRGILGCSNLFTPMENIQVDIRALEIIAGMLRSLLQRENLIQSLEDQVAERTHQLTTFLDMTMLKESSQHLADILQPTLLPIMRIADCDAVVIHITNEEQSRLELIAQRGISLSARRDLNRIELDPDLVDWLRQGEPIVRSGDLRVSSDFSHNFIIKGFGAYLGNRITTERTPFGVLSCYRLTDQPFSPFEMTFLTALGDLLGIIVENHRLRTEAEELATVQERQRLAREIHDAISQSVYSLSLFARSASDAVGESDQEKLISNLQDIEITALQAMREMRLLLYQLRESAKAEDLPSSLANRFQQVENRLGIKATQDIDNEIKFPPEIHHQIWRILVESLNNVVKHANATQVHVIIACNGEYLSVIIKDNGKGFDVDAYIPGMGLENIRTRAESLDGRLEIISQIGEGTQLIVKVPMTCVNPEERD